MNWSGYDKRRNELNYFRYLMARKVYDLIIDKCKELENNKAKQEVPFHQPSQETGDWEEGK